VTVTAEVDGTTITLSGSANKEAALSIPSGRYEAKNRVYRYPLTWAHCVMLRGVFGSELIVGPALASWASQELERRVQPALEAREAKE